MKELDAKPNGISLIIKPAFEIKKVSPKPNLSIPRFLGFDAMRNMRILSMAWKYKFQNINCFLKSLRIF